MAVPISNVTRRVVYTASGTGPYAFTFEILANTDIAVYKDDTLLTLTTDYTVTIASNGTGSITLVTSPTGATQIAIVGNRTIQRTTDFVTGGDFFANTVNDEMDQQTIFAQQNAEGLQRALQAPQTDPTNINMVLPRKADRAGKYLAFDSNGNPEAGPTSADVDVVAGIADEVVTVAGIASSVTTVAGISSAVSTVSGNTSNVNTVAGISGNVTTVAGISSNVTTVAGISSNVSTVAGISSAVTGVAAISSAVSAVNSNSTNINAVNSNSTNINTCATNIAAIIDAPNQATAAAASAASAAASAASGMYSAVQDKSANYTVVAGDAGDLIRVTTTSGAKTITLPAISTVGDGFKVAIVKWTSDGNSVTISRSASDVINGATSYVLGNQYSSATFVADSETAQWFAVASGLGVSNTVVDSFNGNGSTTAFTLSGDPGSENNTLVTISGVYQSKATYSVSGTTLTFSTAPPTGTANIEVVWTAPLAIGTPSDDTVSTAKLQALAVTTAKLADSNVTTAKIADANVTQAKLATNVAGNGPAFSLYANSTQSIPNATYTKLIFNSTEFDVTGGMVSSSRFTPTVAGYYYITGSVYFGASAESFVQVQKNGNELHRGTDHASQVYSRMVNCLVYLNGSTDYVEIYTYQGSGGSITTTATSSQTFFQGFLARAA